MVSSLNICISETRTAITQSMTENERTELNKRDVLSGPKQDEEK